jgi:hypothetical protein
MASATPGYRQIIPLQDQEKIQKTPQKIKCATVVLEQTSETWVEAKRPAILKVIASQIGVPYQSGCPIPWR